MGRVKTIPIDFFERIDWPVPEATLLIPFPPSANHIWKPAGGGRMFRAKAYNSFIDDVKLTWRLEMGRRRWNTNKLYRVTMFCFPPDNRRRDVDNVIKPTFDALTQAGAWLDDSQIVALEVIKWIPAPEYLRGFAVVGIDSYDKPLGYGFDKQKKGVAKDIDVPNKTGVKR